jgi:hypothetical protein
MSKLPDFVANNTAKRLKTFENNAKCTFNTAVKQGYQHKELTFIHQIPMH